MAQKARVKPLWPKPYRITMTPLWFQNLRDPYLQEKWDKEKAVCSLEDLPIIAEGQLAAENAAMN